MAAPDRLLSLLGLSSKAGRLASGEFQTEDAVKKGAAELVLLSRDASAGTQKKFTDMCTFYGVPCVVCEYDKETLGHAIGKEMRSSAAVLDAGFASAMQKLLFGKNE